MKRGLLVSELDLLPMLNIFLLVLMSVTVVGSRAPRGVIEITLPRQGETVPTETYLITVLADHIAVERGVEQLTFLHQEGELNTLALKSSLEAWREQNPTRKDVLVRMGQGAKVSQWVQVIDLLHELKFDDVAAVVGEK